MSVDDTLSLLLPRLDIWEPKIPIRMFILEGYIKISKKTLEFNSSPSPNFAYPRVLKRVLL